MPILIIATLFSLCFQISWSLSCWSAYCFFFFQAEDGIRDSSVTGVQTCALPISAAGFATAKEADSTRALRPSRRLTVRGRQGVLLTLAFDSTASGFVVRHLAGLGGEGAAVYRMNVWDVDGVTPASRSLVRPGSH